MNYQEARAFLDEVGKSGSVLGLEGMRELLNRLGNPQDELKFIHISGTNGKGSTVNYMKEVFSLKSSQSPDTAREDTFLRLCILTVKESRWTKK